jgi:hypothetical protein
VFVIIPAVADFKAQSRIWVLYSWCLRLTKGHASAQWTASSCHECCSRRAANSFVQCICRMHAAQCANSHPCTSTAMQQDCGEGGPYPLLQRNVPSVQGLQAVRQLRGLWGCHHVQRYHINMPQGMSTWRRARRALCLWQCFA